MNEIIDQLEASLSSQTYLLSLMVALAVPDIAGALESPDGVSTGARYKAWYDTWMKPEHINTKKASIPPQMLTPDLVKRLEATSSPLTGDDCYKFRCSMLHQGTTIHNKSSFSRIMFVEPGASTNSLHMAISDDALIIDLGLFCEEMIRACRAWLAATASSANYLANRAKSVQRYPNGLAPHVVGVAVVS